VVSAVLAGLLAFLPVPASTLPHAPWLPLGAATTAAQGGMDVDILTPSWIELPLAVQPGQSFVASVATAAGARCSGETMFRSQPPLPPAELDETPAPAGVCSWTVDVPPTAYPGSGTIVVDITRSGQTWALYGVVYVQPVGDSRQ
jgi:hypothetical protein